MNKKTYILPLVLNRPCHPVLLRHHRFVVAIIYRPYPLFIVVVICAQLLDNSSSESAVGDQRGEGVGVVEKG